MNAIIPIALVAVPLLALHLMVLIWPPRWQDDVARGLEQ